MAPFKLKKDRSIAAIGAALGVTAAIFSLWYVYLQELDRDSARGDRLPAPPGQVVEVETDDARVFRQAFWRHPGKDDKILRAERRHWRDEESESTVHRWQWFITLRPSPELLDYLRSPENFGLRAEASPRAWSDHSTLLPHWFPETAGAEFHVLQSPSSGLTLLYRARDNLLYATDQGSGFAPAVSNTR
jgi:hypothetical protein